MNNDNKKFYERSERLLELPALIDKVGKPLVRHRAEKRELERKIKAREAAIRIELLEHNIYKACRNKEEREAAFTYAKHTDPNWEGMQERLEQLQVAIDKAMHEGWVLNREHKALRGVLEREYTEILERALDDRALVQAIGQGRGVARA